MATRSRIGVKIGNKKYLSIYCHWDGYPSGVGKLLLEQYDHIDKVMYLMSRGDCSSLHQNSFYADRGETGVDCAEHTNQNDMKQEEHTYLFKDSVWYYCSDNGSFKKLTMEIVNRN